MKKAKKFVFWLKIIIFSRSIRTQAQAIKKFWIFWHPSFCAYWSRHIVKIQCIIREHQFYPILGSVFGNTLNLWCHIFYSTIKLLYFSNLFFSNLSVSPRFFYPYKTIHFGGNGRKNYFHFEKRVVILSTRSKYLSNIDLGTENLNIYPGGNNAK